MRFQTTPAFESDHKRLTADQKRQFREAVVKFNEACDRFAQTRDPSVWPATLRVKSVQKAPGVWEMTWSFSGPDGRATWEWAKVQDDDGTTHAAVRWRRVGTHAVFNDP